MAEIINLREFRKSRDRKAKSTNAARNRAVSGRTKAEAARDEDAAKRAKAEIDSNKIDRTEPDTEQSSDSE
ncbi:MAG: DUF4169 family protein [Alphaproteobacteria bacterium]|nr:DUF4169 family protein [Alphaproteobacteria bacterium]